MLGDILEIESKLHLLGSGTLIIESPIRPKGIMHTSVPLLNALGWDIKEISKKVCGNYWLWGYNIKHGGLRYKLVRTRGEKLAE